MKTLKKALRVLGIIVALFTTYVIAVILHATITDYQPEAELKVEPTGKAAAAMITDSVVSFVTWNIGYGGLGAESSFFYERSGSLTTDVPVTTPKEFFDKNQQGILDFAKNTKVDFYLLQEMDVKAKRSYYVNQYEALQAAMPNFSGAYATNYRVKRVPLPLFQFWDVMGEVEAGLGTFARFAPQTSTRYQFPGNYAWPTRIFQLDRCFLAQRFQVEGGKTLVVVNTHNSAYDKGGKLKALQTAFLKEFLLKEYAQGNYVVVGGDWNQAPPYFAFDAFMKGGGEGYEEKSIEPDYLPEGWVWAFDATQPTNRQVKAPFVAGETFTTLLDYFVVSPNVRLQKVKTLTQNFAFSDHQAVYMEVVLGK